MGLYGLFLSVVGKCSRDKVFEKFGWSVSNG